MRRILILFFCLPILCSAQTSLTLSASKDAAIREYNGIGDGNNYGTVPFLNIQAWTNGGLTANQRSLIDFDLSMIDINETLKLEPRHFGAMDGLSMIFIHLQEFEKAIQIYDQMLKIFPNNSLVVKKRKRLLKLITKST